MSNKTLVDTKKEEWIQLQKAYSAAKSLFIYSEEKLNGMKLFPAPLLEHRDALDHIMRYSSIIADRGLCEEAIHELKSAKAHELRAFYDICDYICITIRKEIYEAIEYLSPRKVELFWKDYRDCRIKIAAISNKIAEIRNGDRENIDMIEEYRLVVDELFGIYNVFLTEVQPKVGRSFLYRIKHFFD